MAFDALRYGILSLSAIMKYRPNANPNKRIINLILKHLLLMVYIRHIRFHYEGERKDRKVRADQALRNLHL